MLGEFKLRVLSAIWDCAKISRKYCCAICNSNQRSANVCINFSLSRLVALSRSPSAQGTSAAEMIFDGTGVENYSVIAVMVGAVYQCLTHNARSVFNRWTAYSGSVCAILARFSEA